MAPTMSYGCRPWPSLPSALQILYTSKVVGLLCGALLHPHIVIIDKVRTLITYTGRELLYCCSMDYMGKLTSIKTSQHADNLKKHTDMETCIYAVKHKSLIERKKAQIYRYGFILLHDDALTSGPGEKYSS